MKLISYGINCALVFLLGTTAVYGQDANGTLHGTYVVNTNWGCTDFNPGFAGTNGTIQVTTTGQISYFGNGTAQEIGRFTVTDHTNKNGDIGRYQCTWAYQINSTPNADCNIGGPNSVVGPIDCDFRYSGSCTGTSAQNPNPNPLLDQVWYGKISISGSTNSKGPNKPSPDILSIERHDLNQERDQNQPNTTFKVCGKNGAQFKISDTPRVLIPAP